jgi:hypothetical protein
VQGEVKRAYRLLEYNWSSESRVNDYMSRRTLIKILIGAVLLVPIPTVVVPPWKVRIVDTVGRPCPDREVRNSWGHYTLNPVFDSGETKNTDAAGYVEFPRRWVWSPPVWRIVAPVLSALLTLMHGGGGRSATIYTDKMADKSRAWITWRPGEPLQQEVVVETCQ